MDKKLVGHLVVAAFFALGASSVSSQEDDVQCFDHEEAAYFLAEASSKSPDDLVDAEKKILEVCGKYQDSKAQSRAKLDEAVEALKLAKYSKIYINNTGSVFYESIDSCGYHPQRRESTCSVEVKRRYGYGGVPGSGPGSFEWMAFCVWNLPSNPNNWTLANVSAVHVHNEPFGNQPSWYYTITDQAEQRLHSTMVNGQTYIAKNILSWGIRPNSCFFNPVWGNEAYYRIRVDP